MAAALLPAWANIKELRLSVGNPADDVTRALNRKRPFATPLREMWAGQILFRPMTRDEFDVLLASLEALDGRALPFKIELKAGKFSASPPITTCSVPAATPTVPGSSTMVLNFDATPRLLKRGTLISIGDIDADLYQVFEVIKDATVSLGSTVSVSPRVRHAFPAATGGAVGTVFAKLKLAESKLAPQCDVASSMVGISVVEAL